MNIGFITDIFNNTYMLKDNGDLLISENLVDLWNLPQILSVLNLNVDHFKKCLFLD